MRPAELGGATAITSPRSSIKHRCGHDGQRKRVAHMPTATTTTEDSRSKLVQNHPHDFTKEHFCHELPSHAPEIIGPLIYDLCPRRDDYDPINLITFNQFSSDRTCRNGLAGAWCGVDQKASESRRSTTSHLSALLSASSCQGREA